MDSGLEKELRELTPVSLGKERLVWLGAGAGEGVSEHRTRTKGDDPKAHKLVPTMD